MKKTRRRHPSTGEYAPVRRLVGMEETERSVEVVESWMLAPFHKVASAFTTSVSDSPIRAEPQRPIVLNLLDIGVPHTACLQFTMFRFVSRFVVWKHRIVDCGLIARLNDVPHCSQNHSKNHSVGEHISIIILASLPQFYVFSSFSGQCSGHSTDLYRVSNALTSTRSVGAGAISYSGPAIDRGLSKVFSMSYGIPACPTLRRRCSRCFS